MGFDFANVLFSGPCNRFCPFCIGKQLPSVVNENNLDRYPLKNQAEFVRLVNDHQIRDVIFTGTISDPQLYRHEGRLLAEFRSGMHSGARFSVHTNGVRALDRMEIFNQYDRACISFPSFEPDTYAKLMGSRVVPDLAAIMARAQIPVKVSCILNQHNISELESFLERCQAIGVRRLVLRRLFGEDFPWAMLSEHEPVADFRGNPVYDWNGMEVTDWNFDVAGLQSINLFPDGTIGHEYLLTRNFDAHGRPAIVGGGPRPVSARPGLRADLIPRWP
ncbi:MAG: radical SAM protein [Spirochaetales bacterium]|nr:radical SAM protein [Leptospiraceae bacterium]MCP5480733.1 radical SAM protein [Spirochaetales bacterium]MCP5484085.1 radical SAM protein [Spirochaetales bacterium]